MINYPNGLKAKSTQKKVKDFKQANRGMRFEHLINLSNEYYLSQDRAVIYKKPTPIKVLHIVNTANTTKIDAAHFLTPSTTDYNGIYRGRYIDFEAKETTNKTSFALKAIPAHQLLHLQRVAEHGAIAFVLIHFVFHNTTYLIDQKHIAQAVSEGKSSIRYDHIQTIGHLVKEELLIPLDYLKVVDEVYFPVIYE